MLNDLCPTCAHAARVLALTSGLGDGSSDEEAGMDPLSKKMNSLLTKTLSTRRSTHEEAKKLPQKEIERKKREEAERFSEAINRSRLPRRSPSEKETSFRSDPEHQALLRELGLKREKLRARETPTEEVLLDMQEFFRDYYKLVNDPRESAKVLKKSYKSTLQDKHVAMVDFGEQIINKAEKIPNLDKKVSNYVRIVRKIVEIFKKLNNVSDLQRTVQLAGNELQPENLSHEIFEGLAHDFAKK